MKVTVIKFTETRVYFSHGYRYYRVFDDGNKQEGTEFGIFNETINSIREERKKRKKCLEPLMSLRNIKYWGAIDYYFNRRMKHLRQRPKLP